MCVCVLWGSGGSGVFVLCSVNLFTEPEQEYIVSLRARNKAGLGSPLYETVRTGRAKGTHNLCKFCSPPVLVCEPLFVSTMEPF